MCALLQLLSAPLTDQGGDPDSNNIASGLTKSTGATVDMRWPPTCVIRVRFRSRAHRLKWVEFVVGSHLTPRIFLRVLRFSSLHKSQHLLIPI